MLEEQPQFVGHALTRSERRDWRFVLMAVGLGLLLLGLLLPIYGHRISAAVTTFSEGSEVSLDFPTLISGQHYAQTNDPVNETLKDVALTVEPVEDHGRSLLGWLFAVLGSGELSLHLGFVVYVMTAIAAWVVVGLLLLSAWRRAKGLRAGLIPAATNLSLLTILAVVLSWQHQFDYAWTLFQKAPVELSPGIGFWLMLVGAASMAVACLGLRDETRKDIINWWALVFAVGLLIWLLICFRPYPYYEIWRFVSDGILVTLRIVLVSFAFILVVSLLGGLGRISSNRVIRWLASLYVEVIRGIPLLVQLLFIWFALPQVFDGIGALFGAISPNLAGVEEWFADLRLDPFAAAVLGLTICYGAYGSEIFRAGISSIHHGQMEAARSLGMSYVQAMRYVILPQAVRVILPPIGNEFVALLKDSTLVSVLAVSDLTRRGREYMARTFLSFDTWILVALCYLVLTLFSSRVVESIETKSSFK